MKLKVAGLNHEVGIYYARSVRYTEEGIVKSYVV